MGKNNIGKEIVALLGGEKKLLAIGASNFRYFEAGAMFMIEGVINKYEARLNAVGMYDVIFYSHGRIHKIDSEIFAGELKESFERETGIKI